MTEMFAADPFCPLQADLIDGGMLLYALAAMPVKRAYPNGWFQREGLATARVISRTEDVSDVLLRLPQNWNIVEGARCIGLHDDEDIVSADPRFHRGFDPRNFAIVGRENGEHFALLMLINAAEAALLPERLFAKSQAFEHCVFAA